MSNFITEKYAEMFEGAELDPLFMEPQTKWNQMIVSLLIEVRDKLEY